MMIFITFLLHLVSAVLKVDILYSQYTDPDVLSALSDTLFAHYNHTITIVTHEIDTFEDLEKLNPTNSIVIDATYSVSLSGLVKKAANELSFVHINLGENNQMYGE